MFLSSFSGGMQERERERERVTESFSVCDFGESRVRVFGLDWIG